MDVGSALVDDGRLPGEGLAPGRFVIVAEEQERMLGQVSSRRIDRYNVLGLPPGKSARAVPQSGMKMVSPTKAALPIT